MPPIDRSGLIIAVIIVVAIPVVIAQIRSIVTWAIQLKREELARKSVSSHDISQQLELLQRSVDAMAIEVERISESQRATARRLTESVGMELTPKSDA